MNWPTHCIHGRPLPAEGEGPWCPLCAATDLALPWWKRLWLEWIIPWQTS